MGDLSSPESKLSWIFTAFDADGGGTIDAQEIRSQMLKIAMAQVFMWMKRMIFRDFSFYSQAINYLLLTLIHYDYLCTLVLLVVVRCVT